MSGTVVRLHATNRNVRQPTGIAAEMARLDLVHGQCRLFPQKKGRARSFEEIYCEAVESRRRLEMMTAEYCERSELAFSEEHINLRLRMAGAVASYRIRLQKLAWHPAQNIEQANLKREIIGEKWLSEPGDFYDQFREAVAIDAQKLGIKP